AGGQAAPERGPEAVEAAVGNVLGEVQHATPGIGRDGLVLEGAECIAAHRGSAAERLAFPPVSGRVLLAREPGGPRRGAPGAIIDRPGADRIRVDDGAGAVEADGADAATRRGNEFAVGGVDPATARGREDRAAVREDGPDVSRRADRLAAARDHPRGEA